VYRKGLEDLTAQLDSLDNMKYQHFETAAQHTRKVWSSVLKRTTLAARAEVDILEKVSEKGLQNDCLGRMIASADDPFDVVPVRVIDKIAQEEPREMYPLSEWTNSRRLSTQITSTATISSGGCGISDYDHPHIVPTTPSPTPQHTNSFEMVDDVASIHSDENTILSQVSQLAIPNAPLNVPETMTPPHTPPNLNENPHSNLKEHNGRLLSKLGGYGWRG
jgi:hypothetical protein